MNSVEVSGATSVVLRGVVVNPSAANSPGAEHTVRVLDGIITQIDPASSGAERAEHRAGVIELGVPGSRTQADRSPRYIMAGLIDASAGIPGSFDSPETGAGRRRDGGRLIAAGLAHQAKLACGITTVQMSAVLPPDLPLALRDARRDTVIGGPRIVVAGRMDPVADTASDTVVTLSRRRRGEGAETVVVVPSHRGDFTPAQLRALADEAHVRRSLISFRPRTTSEAISALANGFDVIDGIPPDADDSLVQAALSAEGCVIHRTRDSGRPTEGVRRFLRSTASEGVRLALGGGDVPDGLRRGVDDLLAAGFDAGAVIASVTENAAWAVCLADSIGSVTVGRVADLLVLDADPRKDPAVLADPAHIIDVIASEDPLTI